MIAEQHLGDLPDTALSALACIFDSDILRAFIPYIYRTAFLRIGHRPRPLSPFQGIVHGMGVASSNDIKLTVPQRAPAAMPLPTSKRVLWKGAISFGLVHIPIALHSAVQSQSIDFDWLDRRSMEPVGYKRINKVTGEEIDRADIVKGISYGEGEYVVMEAEEIAAAYPKTTQTVEIEAFVPIDDIPFVYLERPYYVSPINKGGKVYALLREVLAESRTAGLAKVVIQTKQHLALLFACGPVLILNLLRWGDEVRDWSALNLPEQNKKALGLTSKELDMARQLVKDMTMTWQPEEFTDSFREQIMQLMQEKIDAGETTQVTQPESEEGETSGTARIYDLTEMLQRSLRGRKEGATTTGSSSAKKVAAKKAAAKKTASKAAAPKKAAGKAGSKAAAAKTATAKTTAAKKKVPANSAPAKASKPSARKASKSTARGRNSNSSTASKRRAA